MANPRLDRYIETMAAQLKGLSPAQYDEEVREIRQHLDALVAGHRVAGLSEEEAVNAAIHQFGHAEQVGQELRQAWQPHSIRTLWPSLLIYLVSVVAIFLFFASANDKPTDFPYTMSAKILLALILPCGILLQAVLAYFRRRSAYR